MILYTLNNQVTVLNVWGRDSCENVVMPEIVFKRDQLFLIISVARDMTDDRFVFTVAVKTAEEHVVYVNNRHIMPTLDLVVDGNGFNTVTPPMVCCVVVCGLDLKYCRFAIWQGDEVIDVSQHKRIQRMIEHLFDLIDVIARPHVEDLGNQILK